MGRAVFGRCAEHGRPFYLYALGRAADWRSSRRSAVLVAALSASMLWLSRPRTPRQFQAAADSTTAVRALGENQRPGVRSLDDEECEEGKEAAGVHALLTT